jgi:single-strand DNA-binding protein
LLAVDRGFGRDSGTDWIRVVIWGKAAESAAQYLDKGSKIALSGRLVGNFYKSKESGKDKLDMEVATSQVQFLSSPRSAGAAGAKSNGKAA